jgi:hypothetical protein
MMKYIVASEEADLCKDILAIAFTVYRPITLSELASLTGLPDGVAQVFGCLTEIIGLCGSFLTLRNQTILLVHQSAKEFFIVAIQYRSGTLTLVSSDKLSKAIKTRSVPPHGPMMVEE